MAGLGDNFEFDLRRIIALSTLSQLGLMIINISIVIWNENQLISLFYSYIAGSLHVSGPQAHPQESSHSCSHNHWFSICTARVLCMLYNIQSTRTERHRYWSNGCVNSCTNSPEDGLVDPKHVETQQYTNKIVTSVGFHSICWKDARYKKLKISIVLSGLSFFHLLTHALYKALLFIYVLGVLFIL